jgi:DNA (cytosine-5)-methyltransferase 1
MKYLSVCSGIEAATVAWHHMGWKPVGFSEIEKFPSQVLAHHYPQVTNFGDMTKYKDWNINDPVGLLVGGTPCQSFSVAGLRKGLDDPRGNLALTYCGILDHFRPKWCVWENVPGVLSSGGGRDFGSFLGALAKLGYGFSYRVLDSQYFGVAQRRRRVFVVGHFGDWKPTAKVLFESDCLRRDIEKGKRKKQNIARNVVQSVVYENHPSDSRVKEMGEVCQTVTSSWGTGGGNIPFVQTYGFEPGITKREGNPNRFNKEISPTLRADMGDNQVAIANIGAIRKLTPTECERLQGFPDNYTNIKENCPDGGRYKALGNSMAVPVMRWIGERINQYERL